MAGEFSPDISSVDRLNRTIALVMAAADPKIKGKVLNSMRAPLREGIIKNYGHALDIAPTIQVIPIMPQPGSEKETLDTLEESMKWAREQDGVQSAFIYQLISGDEKKRPPTYIAVITTEDKSIMTQLQKSQRGAEFQKKLIDLSGGKSATDAGMLRVNSMLIDL